VKENAMTQPNQDCAAADQRSIDYNWTAPISDEEFDYFREIAHREAGISIADFKRNMVFRRVSKRVRLLGLKSIDEYCRYLDSGNWERERQALINALTTNKTSFFREEHHFRYLEQSVLPDLAAASRKGGSRRLRIWSAGCSSGEEPYSIAMTLNKMIDNLKDWDARILATDIDTEMVEHGQRGVFINEFLDDIPGDLRLKHASVADSGHFKMAHAMKQLITFKALNLLGQWPMKGPFDMIFCRNVVIYFDKPTKQMLFDRFADILKPDGLLFIGHSESLFKVTKRFRMVGQSVYQRIE
jgi:chemotaxis protein methyltransferase CheR